MEKIAIDREGFVRLVGDKARFTYKDIRIILRAIEEVFEEALSTETEINIRGFGKLYYQDLPARKGSSIVGGGILPPAKRAIFKLAKNMRRIVKV